MPKLTHAQRLTIPAWSLAHDGFGNGTGYPGASPNEACIYVGHGLEYSCADGVTATYGKAGYPLLPFQPGMAEGYAYVPDALAAAKKIKGAVINSWDAHVGDILLINTGAGAQPGHTEVIYQITGTGAARKVYSVGWDSGPSNVNRYTGQGGTHRHVWADPAGKGNGAFIAVLDADLVIDWTKVAADAKAHKVNVAKAATKRLAPRALTKTAEGKVSTVIDALEGSKAPVKVGSGDRNALRRLMAAIKARLNRKA